MSSANQPIISPKVDYSEDYLELSDRDHVLRRPDSYVGSGHPKTVNKLMYVERDGIPTLEVEVNTHIPAVRRVFLEVLSNATDVIGATRRALTALAESGLAEGSPDYLQARRAAGWAIYPLRIDYDQHWVHITNYGKPFPTHVHKTSKVPIPEMILSRMRSGSNYGDKRQGAGTNGYGAKLTNMLSEYFGVEIYNAEFQQSYKQVWRNNLGLRGEPTYGDYQGDESSVTISYLFDFARYNLEGYTADMQALMLQDCIDMSFSANIPVIVNGRTYDFQGLNYVKFYKPEPNSAVLSYETENIRLHVIDAPDQGYTHSFANNLVTEGGGIHVDLAMEYLGQELITKLNELVLKSLGKSAATMNKRQLNSYMLNTAMLKKHLIVLLSVNVTNPSHTSQSKEILAGPSPYSEADQKALAKLGLQLKHFKLYKRLTNELSAREIKVLKKGDGKKTKYVDAAKLEDANCAGTKHSMDCVLYAAEGDSGLGYLGKMLTHIPTKRDYIGILPMRGKGLNCIKAELGQITANHEVKQLIMALGLKFGVDYREEKALKSLRYGKLCITADADVDGQHIIGLLLTFMYRLFPTLLEVGFVQCYFTPVIRVTLPVGFVNHLGERTEQRELKPFYSMPEYAEWAGQQDPKQVLKLDHRYYKGLASSSNDDVAQDCRDRRVTTFYLDDQAESHIHLAFDPDMSTKRKIWIVEYQKRASQVYHIGEHCSLTEFINYCLVRYSEDDMLRSLPGIDGFKICQRKVAYSIDEIWKNKRNKVIKVSQIASTASQLTHYLHNDDILSGVVTKMAQGFAGTNNLPIFQDLASFGSRYHGGKDAGKPRYTSTKPAKYLKYLIRAEDRPLLERLTEEGELVEPQVIHTVIPLAVVNGSLGIGTGHSSFIPSYHPHEVIELLRTFINGEEPEYQLKPWFRGFKGEVELVQRRSAYKEPPPCSYMPAGLLEAEQEYQAEGDELVLEASTIPGAQSKTKVVVTRVKTTGTFEIMRDGAIKITELPIGLATITYVKWLKKLVLAKEITDYKDSSNENYIEITISGWQQPVTHRALGLVRFMSLSNMTVLIRNRPYRYRSANSLIRAFYEERIVVYEQRRQYQLAKLLANATRLQQTRDIVEAIVDKRLKVTGRATKDVMADMDRLGLKRELIKGISQLGCTKEQIAKLEQQVQAAQDEYDELNATTAGMLWLDDLSELEQHLPK